MTIRKTMIIKETTQTDALGHVCDPITRVVAMAVVKNPFAGKDQADLSVLFDLGGRLANELMPLATEALGKPAISYGKAAIVGANGDMEHGAAMIHPKLGKPMREALGGGAALIPSNAKLGVLGAPIDIPLGHKDEAWNFSHFDTITVAIGDAPRPDEIVLCMAISDGPRPYPRAGDGPITD